MSDNDSDWLARELKKTHKDRRRVHIASVVGVCLLVGISILILHSVKHNPTLKVADTSSNIQTSTPSVAGSSTTSTSPTTTSTSNSQEQATLSQEEAQDKADAAQDEANAEQDLKNAEDSQSTLNSETPPASSTTEPTISVPAVTTPLPAPSCTGSSNLTSTYNAYIQAEGALDSFEQDPASYVATAGISAAVVESEEQSKLSSLEGAASQAQSAYQAAESSFSC
ncbi:MAG TPA: hypothetical protein VMR18_02765 [Candidatus Saccharimonadales bacterium]|nr:hypothetical protein [Candidatus Saccharimonadales bacterium]